MRKVVLFFSTVFFLLLAATYAEAATIYVKHNATGSNNGTSWTNAYTDLQVAMNAAAVGDEIWVAAGTYKPTQKPTGVTTADNRLQTFYLNKDVKLYGGFAGTETALSQRNHATNVTILSADIGTAGTNNDNCYHVFITKDLTAAAVIDGFTVKDGYSQTYSTSSMTYDGATFGNYEGGGFYNYSSSPTLTNVTVSGNTAYYGGGFYNYSSSPTLTNVTVSGNTAYYDGGGFFNYSSSPTLTNVTVSGNTASYGGGFYNNYYASPTLTNVTVSGNTAYNGGGFNNNYYSSPNIRNSIVWNNGSSEVYNDFFGGTPTFYYSIVKGSGGSSAWNSSYGSNGGNNLDADPLFVSSSNLSLQNGSPAINAGNNSYNTTTTDLAGNARIQNGTIDMGAYEFVSCQAANAGYDQTVCISAQPFALSGASPVGGTWTGPGVSSAGVFSPQAAGGFGFYTLVYTFADNNGCQDADTISVYVIFGDTVLAGQDMFVSVDAGIIYLGGYPVGGTWVGNGITDPVGGTFDPAVAGTGAHSLVYTYGTGTCMKTDAMTIFVYSPVVYVNRAASGANDGSSWADAFTDLQDAIDEVAAAYGGEIWVAAGVYVPTRSKSGVAAVNNRNNTFCIKKDGTRIYGGFAGTETTRSQRDSLAMNTILSGDMDNDNTNSDNAFHVLYLDGSATAAGITAATVLNGLVIEKGNANKFSSDKSSGGGLLNVGNETGKQCSPSIANCMFRNNNALFFGGAMYNKGYQGGASSPVVSQCVFVGNTAHSGGAICNDGDGGNSSPVIASCAFENNVSSANNGGAICFLGDGGSIKAQVSNSVFSANGSNHIGYDDGEANQQPNFMNCTFVGATAQAIKRIAFDSGLNPIDFTNCIFWNNNNDIADNNGIINLRYSVVEEAALASASKKNYYQNPAFENAADADGADNRFGTSDDGLRVKNTSVCLNNGTAVNAPATDFIGTARPQGNGIDIGAYEWSCGITDTTYTTATTCLASEVGFQTVVLANQYGCDSVVVKNVSLLLPTNTTWKKNAKVTVAGTTLIKSAGSGTAWDAGSNGVSTLLANEDGWIETTVFETNTERVIGLAKPNTSASKTNIDYGIHLFANGQYRIIEKNVLKTSNKAYSTNNVFKIERTNGTVKYYRNGTLVYTSAKTSTTDLITDASLKTMGATLYNVKEAFGCGSSNSPKPANNIAQNTISGVSESGTLGSLTVVSVYPNPANTELNIALEKVLVSEVHIAVFAATGQLVESRTTTDANVRLNTTNWASGLYFVKIRNGEHLTTQKVMIQH